jgi:hypothetical protein
LARPPVTFMTSSRTRPKAKRMSRPGTGRCVKIALVKGL